MKQKTSHAFSCCPDPEPSIALWRQHHQLNASHTYVLSCSCAVSSNNVMYNHVCVCVQHSSPLYIKIACGTSMHNKLRAMHIHCQPQIEPWLRMRGPGCCAAVRARPPRPYYRLPSPTRSASRSYNTIAQSPTSLTPQHSHAPR